MSSDHDVKNLMKDMAAIDPLEGTRADIANHINTVIDAHKSLLSYVQEFEQQLDEEHEVGVRLVSFGSEVKIHVHKIDYSPPNIITFYGVTANRENMQLIQHVSQLSFLLMAVKKIGDKPYRIGFNLSNQPR